MDWNSKQFDQAITHYSLSDGNDNVTIYTSQNQTVYGGGGDDFIDLGDSNDEVHGGADNDQIYAGGGSDFIHGDGGNDTLNGSDGDDQLFGGYGIDKLNGGDDDDIIYSVYNQGIDYTATGDEGPEILQGGAGNDTLYANRGTSTELWGALMQIRSSLNSATTTRAGLQKAITSSATSKVGLIALNCTFLTRL